MTIWIFCGDPVSVCVVVKLGKGAVGVYDLFEAVVWVILETKIFSENPIWVAYLLSDRVSLCIVLIVDCVSEAIFDLH